MNSGNGAGVKRRVPRWFIPALGYAISIAALIWVYRGFDWGEQLAAASGHRLAAGDLSRLLRTLLSTLSRRGAGISSSGRLIFSNCRSTVQAIYIGLFANEVLPLRSGEVIRCYLLARWNELHVSVVLSSALIERLLDGAWLALGFWVITYFSSCLATWWQAPRSWPSRLDL